jgi:quercetin dioxygenase-like cupin family protein
MFPKGGASDESSRVRGRAQGCRIYEIESKALDPRPVNSGHTHDYDIRGLVLSGIFIVNQGDAPVTYRVGEIFAVPAGRKHTEEIGADGARIVVGKKY